MPAWIPRLDTPRRVLVEQSTAQLSAPTVLPLLIEGLGTDGRFLAVGCSVPAWISFYATAAAREADAERLISADPSPSAGVLLDLLFDAQTRWLTPAPGSTYSNGEQPLQARLFALLRTQQLGVHAATLSVLALVELELLAAPQTPASTTHVS
ncbi:MAG: hypothetical protein ACKO8I_02010 [Cyanobacteriota bacterium]